MYKVYDNYYDCNVCYVNTEEEAQRICNYANAHGEYYEYYDLKFLVSTADKEIANIKKRKEDRINILTERIKRTTEGVATLKRCKEFLDRYLIGIDDFAPLIPEMYEAVMKTDLPISFYDGEQSIDIDVNNDWFYHYENGNYNIEDDIKRLENAASEFKAELAQEQSRYKMTSGAKISPPKRTQMSTSLLARSSAHA